MLVWRPSGMGRPMGLWDELRSQVRQGLRSPRPRRNETKAADAPPVPDPGGLMTAEEIEAATGHRPLGEGDRKGGLLASDVGFSRVCEWMLAGGDELLVNVCRLHDRQAAALWESRNWNEEEPLAGIGDMGRFLVTKDHKGRTELHVTARQGLYTVMLVHSSAAGLRDVEPLRALAAQVLTRFN